MPDSGPFSGLPDLAWVVMLVFFAELLVFWTRPHLLARLAYVPLRAQCSFEAPAGAVEFASEEPAGYRSPAHQRVALERLAWPADLRAGDADGGCVPARGMAWVRAGKGFFGNKARAVARIDVLAEGTTIRLRASYYPVPTSLVLWPIVPMATESIAAGALFVVVVAAVVAFNILWIHVHIREAAGRAMATIEQSLRQAPTE